jgi:K+-transporting ATPase ATPase A chain
MAGLTVQNSLPAAVGIAVALVCGFMRSRTDRLGSFWVSLTRVTSRVLLPPASRPGCRRVLDAHRDRQRGG